MGDPFLQKWEDSSIWDAGQVKMKIEGEGVRKSGDFKGRLRKIGGE